MIQQFFVVTHEEYDNWDESVSWVVGIFDTENRAMEARHWKMRSRLKDGSMGYQARKGQPQFKVYEGCDRIWLFSLNQFYDITNEPEEIKPPDQEF